MTEYKQLEEIYECVFGDGSIDRYTHEEVKDRILEMYDIYQNHIDSVGGRDDS